MCPRNLIIAACLGLLATGCARSTADLPAVRDFSLKQYSGTWYEVERFPHSFEEGLQSVSATYTLLEDGGVRVINRGYDTQAGHWKSVEGYAEPAGNPEVGLLDVTFFWPFYGTYKILALKGDPYSCALVTGDSYEYLWILARTPDPPEATVRELRQKARRLGFDVSRLMEVRHDRRYPGDLPPGNKR